MRALTLAVAVVSSLAAAAFTTPAAAAEKAPPTMVVLPTKLLASAAGRSDPELVDAAVLTALQKSGRLRVLGKSDLAAALELERQKDLLGCAANACFVEIGGALAAEYLVDVEVGRVDGRWRVSAKVLRLPTEVPVVEGRVAEAVRGGAADLLTALAPLMRDLVTEAGLPPCVRCGIGRPALIWILDLNQENVVDRRVVEDAIIEAWSARGFTFIDRSELTAPLTREEVRAQAAATGAELVIGVVASVHDTGPIMGTQMHSIRARASMRVYSSANSQILAVADIWKVVGHIDVEAGAQKALRVSSRAAAEELLDDLFAGS